MNNGNGGLRWRCPRAGLVKINFDGVVFSESHMSNTGVVIRGDKGAIWHLAQKKSIKHTRLTSTGNHEGFVFCV